MAAFQKNAQPAPGGDRKKLFIMLGLALVLGVVVFNYLHKSGGPKIATAAELPTTPGTLEIPAVMDAAPTETAAQAMADLQNDPTVKLLRPTDKPDLIPTEAPRDPFAMAGGWRDSLVKAETTTPVAHTDHAAPRAAVVVALDPAAFKIAGIFRRDQHLTAIINGQIVTIGMCVGNAKVSKMTETSVTLQSTDSPNSSPITITIEPKLH